uniref:NADH dehydrogenase [ubiquinone] 1 beta subcomplex subunit 6 n=1 Tax=Ailuropoda melanoleuca TaxID=9646 RepID=A0A7N5K4U2_AILME
MSRGSGIQPRDLPEEVIGYTPEEKLRRQQLRELRRRWLKDQELSPREPVLPPRKVGLVEGFWQRFLQPERLWKRQVTPHGIVEKNPTIYPGDRMEEKRTHPPPHGTAAELPFCED